MKRVVTEQWVAFDGVPHPTEAECRAYERRVAHIRMVGLKIEDVEAALTRADLDLAEAFEEVARRIKRIRLGKGAATVEADPDGDVRATSTNGEPKPEFPPAYDPQDYPERVA